MLLLIRSAPISTRYVFKLLLLILVQPLNSNEIDSGALWISIAQPYGCEIEDI